MTTRITSHNRIVLAVGKHIVAENALAGGNECVGTNESAPLRVVITGLQVVQTGFLIIHISPVAERIENTKGICHRASGRNGVAPGIIAVVDNRSSGAISQLYNSVISRYENIIF